MKTDIDDLITRLNDWWTPRGKKHDDAGFDAGKDVRQAAAELVRLRARVAELEAQLAEAKQELGLKWADREDLREQLAQRVPPREPTQDMIEATWQLDADHFRVDHIWRAMYDVATSTCTSIDTDTLLKKLGERDAMSTQDLTDADRAEIERIIGPRENKSLRDVLRDSLEHGVAYGLAAGRARAIEEFAVEYLKCSHYSTTLK